MNMPQCYIIHTYIACLVSFYFVSFFAFFILKYAKNSVVSSKEFVIY